MIFLLDGLFNDTQTNELIDEFIADYATELLGNNAYDPSENETRIIKNILRSEIAALLDEVAASIENMPDTLSGLLELLAMLQHAIATKKKVKQRINKRRVNYTKLVDKHINNVSNFLIIMLLSPLNLSDFVQILRLELEHKIGLGYSR